MADVSAASTTAMPASAGNKIFLSSLTRLSLSTVNRFLCLLAVVVLVYFVLTLLGGIGKLLGVNSHIRALEKKSAQGASTAAAAKEIARPEAVDPALSNRNIFQPAGVAAASPDAPVSLSGSGAYRLVGISLSKDPLDTYVMVENSQTKLTYFLQYNQPVEGLELEKILEDKVIVKIGGKSVELE